MSEIELSVILCSHNPKEMVISRILKALNVQTLDKSKWELLIIDNASSPPLKARTWAELPSNTQWVIESKLGLTHARLAGFRDARGKIFILVDDDTELASDYLSVALEFMNRHPEVGTAGGKIIGEFSGELPNWAKSYQDLLAIRNFGDKPIRALINNQAGPWEPCGAGMVVRSTVAKHYAQQTRDGMRLSLDRVGNALSSCGDTDLARTAPDLGLYQAYEPRLQLTHVIPENRLRLEYLAKLTFSIQRDGWLLYRLRGKQCAIGGWHYYAYLLRAFATSFSLYPQVWVLRAASALGQIKGRSIKLDNSCRK